MASGAAKKRLFGDSRSGGQSILKDKCSAKILTIDGTSRIVVAVPESATAGPSRTTNALAASPAASSTPAAAPPPSSTRESGKPRRTGSAALFFRKFYMLGAIRMQNLCDALLIVDTEMRNKIWTIFEFSIKERTNLMKDRHLDQILMSAAYVVCKLAKNDRNSFTEIMRCYRFQPQAQSHIYRSVLLARIEPANATTEEPMEIDKRNERNDDAVAPPTPSNMAGTSGTFGNEIRGDLIKFYNEVYVPAVQAFACNFGPSKGPTLSLTLSPLPRHKPRINSPVRHVTDSVRTRTLDPKDFIASTAPHHLTYCFSRSPAKVIFFWLDKLLEKLLEIRELLIFFLIRWSTEVYPLRKKILKTSNYSAYSSMLNWRPIGRNYPKELLKSNNYSPMLNWSTIGIKLYGNSLNSFL